MAPSEYSAWTAGARASMLWALQAITGFPEGIMDNVTIGQAVRRTEDLRFLTGAGRYIDDMWRAIEEARDAPAVRDRLPAEAER